MKRFWRLMLAAALAAGISGVARAEGEPANATIRARLEAWQATQSWSGEGSYSVVVFSQEAYADFFDQDYLPLLRFGGGWYPLPNLSSTLMFGGMYEAADSVGSITGERSGVNTTLIVAPVQYNLRYRFRFLENQLVVPSVWAGLDYWYFQINADEADNLEGDKTGWHWGADLGLLLDPIDPPGARSIKKYWGVDDTYLCLGYEALQVGEGESGLRFSGEVYSLSLRFDANGQ